MSDNVTQPISITVLHQTGLVEVEPARIVEIKTLAAPSTVISYVTQQGPPGPKGDAGDIGPKGDKGDKGDSSEGIQAVSEDFNPHLGGDLKLNGHVLVGQLETSELVLDGGLL